MDGCLHRSITVYFFNEPPRGNAKWCQVSVGSLLDQFIIYGHYSLWFLLFVCFCNFGWFIWNFCLMAKLNSCLMDLSQLQLNSVLHQQHI